MRGFLGLGAFDSSLDGVFIAVASRLPGALFSRFFAGRPLGRFLRLRLFQAFLPGLEAHAGVFRFFVFATQLQYFRLGCPVVLHQRDIAGAYPGTGAALDTVKQVVLFQLFEFLALGEPEHLLRQQARRTSLGAHAAAYAGLGGWWRGQFRLSGGQQAVGGFDHGSIRCRHRESHHRPAHDHALVFPRLVSRLLQQVADGCADQYVEVLGLRHSITGNRGNPGDKWPPQYHGVMHGSGGANILADDAHVRWQSAAGHLLAGEYFYQLFLAA